MIKVLIIDHSAFIRTSFTHLLDSDNDIAVSIAKTYEEAMEKLSLQPDVILLSIAMPEISGLDILAQIMKQQPTPVILTSSLDLESTDDVVTAIRYGAVDVIERPKTKKDIAKIADDFIAFIKIVAAINVKQNVPQKQQLSSAPRTTNKIVVIGASTGGPMAIESILSSLPKNFPAPILIVQHLPKKFTSSFSRRLERTYGIDIKEVADGDELLPGKFFVAPGGKNIMLVERGNKVVFASSKEQSTIHPSIDIALTSAAKIYKKNMIAVILTGMGSDGARGAKVVKDNGGKLIVQDKESSLVFGIPGAVINRGYFDFILPLKSISKKIGELL